MPYQPSQQPYFDDRHGEASDDDFPPPPPVHRNLPNSMHPDSAYSRMQTQRQYGVQNSPNNYSDYSPPGVTPGADNLGQHAAGGGINGIAIDVANHNERDSGAQALRNLHPNYPQRYPNATPFGDSYAYDHPMSEQPNLTRPAYGSSASLAGGAVPPAGMYSQNNSTASLSSPLNPNYQDSPYNRYSSSNLDLAPQMGEINPNEVADDDDWGMGPQGQNPQTKRRSFVPFGASRDGSRESTPGTAAGAAAGAAAAGGAAAVGAGAGAAALAGTRDGNAEYNAVPGGANAQGDFANEKSAWLASQNKGKKRLTWIVSIVIALVVIGAIVGGVLGAVLRKSGKGESSVTSSAADEVAEDNKDDLGINSDEIKALMNNQNLHKVFPGMDYTPLNAQYPDCMHVPPSQNNITRDMAVLSQLTNAVRLYGTDCNQTEMVLHAIDRLELKDMKVWLGVWLGNNETTNDRQVSQMWDIIDKHGEDRFKGIIVGNEVLFREDLTETELLKYITDIRQNISDHNMNLHIATSDLGDNWTADMATKVDIVMSNVHPFFAGVNVEVAADWTWTFWQEHDVILTKDNPEIKQIVAEVGWPSGGGNNCGSGTCTSDTEGSVAGID